MAFTPEDYKHMKKALRLAAKGTGFVSPNPLVGCVIVSDDGTEIGSGYHERFGKAHAEINALNAVREPDALRGATLYVTLEPCSHTGKTPPCAATLKELPLARVVIALRDPNPKVDGSGIRMLQEAGIQVDTGLLEDEARKQNEFFLHYITTGKPFITLKVAQTIDGYIAAPDGSSQWITGKQARTRVHEWRAKYDAVLIGRNTALTDNPRLTVRHVDGRQPKRVVIDGPLSLPENLNLFTDQYEDRTFVITHNEKAFREKGDPMLRMLSPQNFSGQTLLLRASNGHTDLDQAITLLGRHNIASVLVEPGSDLLRAFITQKLADKIELFIAPKLLGGGTRSFIGLDIQRIEEALKLRKVSLETVGEDILVSAYF
ncbi:diaminohydroxyphosphoribosylaminopyrimidine deaminase [Cyclonatronum proteinivorum]|uniref:Riboflavin biosynthesis protein RibD n=1 Tax=Cyclonatronum proteinivorum TaxID=1457365 RepID=A0A345UFS5_9BACT|nr:bifunctional diaminohydroxyphosphoribosylaminopyrimidine deaminase/5-amino-6-(5-phosphoribosylamino)uracil reductase RibD [Cyclonatronum proteinivorum]AXI99326.1 diaminohydroxyphosphoribosylaminopyrimidine deaminase [Cyclonatronum proteinivorum]